MNSDTKHDTLAIPTQSTPQKDADRPIVITVQNLIKNYDISGRHIKALDTISIDIRRGEFVAIVGASGSGKSTLLQLIGGLDKPTSGEIIINGVRLSKMSDRKLSSFRNQTIGFVFQFFYLQPFLNLSRNIEIAAMPNRMSRKERAVRIARLAAQFGLAERLSHLPSELSGGQIQRTAIIRALLNQPSIILADEPTGNLDSQNSHDIIASFKQVRDQYNTTVIIATHDNEIAAQADRIITIKDGRIA